MNDIVSVNNHFLEAIVSKKNMKRLAFSPDYNAEEFVLISIQDPDDEENLDMYKERFKDCVSLRFWDTEEDLGVKSGGFDVVPINKFEANKIIDFIINHKEERFFIHCAAGQSRSAGTGIALETILKFDGDKYIAGQFPSDIKAMSTYSPNLKVYDVIIEEFNKRKLTIDKKFECDSCDLSFDKYITQKREEKDINLCPICSEELIEF